MNIWITRTVGAVGIAGIAGGVVLGGTVAASADTATDQRDSSRSGSVSAPLEFGGLHAGLERSDSSREDRASATSDEDGTTSSRSSREDSSSERYGLDVGKLSTDPAGSFSRDDASRDRRSGGVDGVRDSEEASSSAADFSSPFRFDGVDLFGERWTQAMEDYASRTADEDGASASRGSRSETSKQAGGLSVGEIAGDPSGAFSDERRSRSSEVGGVDGVRRSAEGSTRDGDLSLPYSSEGGSGFVEDSEKSASDSERAVTDEDGTSATRSHDEDASHTRPSGGVDGVSGDLTGDGLLQDAREMTGLG